LRFNPVDASGVITAMNPSARQIYGYPDAEIVGRTFEILLPPRIRDQVRRQPSEGRGNLGFHTTTLAFARGLRYPH
jgi:PAS domain S-box-containing protein